LTTQQRKLFGKRLRMAREAKGMSQGELAATTGLSQGHLSNIELGRWMPSVGSLLVIAKGLGLTPDRLLLK
jgi:transcriptional regulator with XRE-family HTH domain